MRLFLSTRTQIYLLGVLMELLFHILVAGYFQRDGNTRGLEPFVFNRIFLTIILE